MAEKNLETYLAEQETEYQKKSEKIEKRKNFLNNSRKTPFFKLIYKIKKPEAPL